MKKCPYCAEKIQNDAIVCRYCGRDLPQPSTESTLPTTSQTTTMHPPRPTVKENRSVWATGAIWATAITILAAIGNIIRSVGSPINSEAENIVRTNELIGDLTLGAIANFVVWFLVFSFLTWAWRKDRSVVTLLLIIALLFFVGIIVYNGGNLNKPFRTLIGFSPIQIPTFTYVPTQIIVPTPTIDRFKIPFFDNFSDSNSGWYIGVNNDRTMEYSNGGYRINVISVGKFYFSYLKSLSTPRDVRIEVDELAVTKNDFSYFGIICRYASGDNYYYSEIWNIGRAAIYKSVNGVLENISQRPVPWDNPPVSQSQYYFQYFNIGSPTNHIRVDCIGNNITLYVNSETIISVTDNSISSGSVGLAVGNNACCGTDILFDNFSVVQP